MPDRFLSHTVTTHHLKSVEAFKSVLGGTPAFLATLISTARKGVSGHIGDGNNDCPTVHRFDAAHLFRLAVEQVPAGLILHGVADEGVPVRTIAEVIAQHLNLPVVSVPSEAKAEHVGWLGTFFGYRYAGLEFADA